MSEPFVHTDQMTIQYGEKQVLNKLSWTWNKGEHWVIGGQSGTGKSTLGKLIAGILNPDKGINIYFDESSHLSKKVLYIPNWYQFTNLEGDRNFYYQQRYNRHQRQDTLTVRSELEHYGKKHILSWDELRPIVETFQFCQLLNAQLIELSSGEHKKLQLIKALWQKPQLLILDEPYTGLDNVSREALNTVLDHLASTGVHLMLISNERKLPSAINRYAEIKRGRLQIVSDPLGFSYDAVRMQKTLPDFLRLPPEEVKNPVVALHNVCIRYGDKEVLKNITWNINKGEKWLLQGHNGSGKSTLLSLLNGDHPQAYGHDITLFGTKRGSGESIWDIKKKIGIISPEMHWYFDQNATVWHTVASGFYDSIGWFVDVKFEEKNKIDSLLDFFELTAVKDDLLTTLPLGKQRLAMLARTIIKNPPLLVLDEPCQGLDTQQTQYFNDVVDELCQYGNTLVYVGHYESQLPKCIEHSLLLKDGVIKEIKMSGDRVIELVENS